jgi:hypothetical protein
LNEIYSSEISEANIEIMNIFSKSNNNNNGLKKSRFTFEKQPVGKKDPKDNPRNRVSYYIGLIRP